MDLAAVLAAFLLVLLVIAAWLAIALGLRWGLWLVGVWSRWPCRAPAPHSTLRCTRPRWHAGDHWTPWMPSTAYRKVRTRWEPARHAYAGWSWYEVARPTEHAPFAELTPKGADAGCTTGEVGEPQSLRRDIPHRADREPVAVRERPPVTALPRVHAPRRPA